MKTKLIISLVLIALLCSLTHAAPLGSAFNYQGRLAILNKPQLGLFDFRLGLYDAARGGNQLGDILTMTNILVDDGIFTVKVDFGTVFDGSARWIEIALRRSPERVGQLPDPYTVLEPRQILSATPYALYALTPAGPQGTQGLTGATGPAGSPGAKGDPGLIGPAGAAGPQGIQGVAGAVGPFGPPGSIGLTGATGNTGPAGGTGAAGATGALGPTGPEGLKWRGTWSIATSYVIDDAVFHNGSSWIAKGNSTGSHPMPGNGNWDLLADKGATGAAGATGATGPQGPTGSTGATGVAGPAGATGAIGPQGSQGPAGSADAWGRLGTAGTSAGTHFLGTTDNQALELRVNGIRGFRLQPGTVSPNVVGGGFSSVAAGLNAVTIGGGQENNVSSHNSTIGGGFRNFIGSSGQDSTIGGGQVNGISNNTVAATVAGGTLNVIGAGSEYAAIGGGRFNRISNGGVQSTIGGGRNNLIDVNSIAATIAGGTNNLIGGNSLGATVGGGLNNLATGSHSTIGGGDQNTSSGSRATVSGGAANTSSGQFSTVGGGAGNTSSNLSATVGGGSGNTSSDQFATVGGGNHNTSSGYAAMVPGGEYNSADGGYSFAAGHGAKANHHGTFVWADSAGVEFASTANDQFSIRARGGVRLSDDTPHLSFGSQTRQMLNLWGTQHGIGVQNLTTYFRTDNGHADSGFAWFRGGVHSHAAQDPGAGGQKLMSLTANGLEVNGAGNAIKGITSNGGASGVVGENSSGGIGIAGVTTAGGIAVFGSNPNLTGYAGYFDGRVHATGEITQMSDRNVKRDFARVDSRQVLEKVARLDIQSWAYTNSAGIRHLGAVAQDFKAAFNLGSDDKSIATVDADGVALAAIQGLNQKVEEQRAENSELKQRLEKLEQLIRGSATRENFP